MEKIRIYVLYWQIPNDTLEFILERKSPEKKFEIKKYPSIYAFRENDKRRNLTEGDVLVAHLGQDSPKEDPETLAGFVHEIRSKWPFCRIGIESGTLLYRTGKVRKEAPVEKVLENNLPDFYFYSRFQFLDDPFFVRMLLKGALSNEEITWRKEGNVMTSVVEIGPGGRIERE